MFYNLKTWIKNSSIATGTTGAVGVISGALLTDGFLTIAAFSNAAVAGTAGMLGGGLIGAVIGTGYVLGRKLFGKKELPQGFQEYGEVGFESLGPCVDELEKLASNQEMLLELPDDFFAESTKTSSSLLVSSQKCIDEKEPVEQLSELGLVFKIT